MNCLNLPLLMVGVFLVLILVIAIHSRNMTHVHQIRQVQEKGAVFSNEEAKSKPCSRNAQIPPISSHKALKDKVTLLRKVIQNIIQKSISSSHEHTDFYQEDLQSIIDKFWQWTMYVKQGAQSHDHMLLQTQEMVLGELVEQVGKILMQKKGPIPRLLTIQNNHTGKIPPKITGDLTQLIELLLTAVIRIGDAAEDRLVRIQYCVTHLQYKRSDPSIDTPHTAVFPSIALVISHSNTQFADLPKVANMYWDDTEIKEEPYGPCFMQEKLDSSKKKITCIIRAHYGYLSLPNPNALLLVIPQDVIQVQKAMIAMLPREALTSAVGSQEQAASLTKLVNFQNWIATETTVESSVISEILLLLRRCYGFKKHACGSLFYVRAVGIAQLVATWMRPHPKVIYASLLYDLVTYTCLPRSYIKANYKLEIFYLIESVLTIDTRIDLQSLLSTSNHETLEQEPLSVLYVKFAERLYDLNHVLGYTHIEMVKSMAKETLTIDIKLANRYLKTKIATALKNAAQAALAYDKRKA